MPLVTCPECQREISSEALTCPACGKPNTAARNKAKDSQQKVGCAVMVAALFLFLVLPPIAAGAIFIVGLVIMMVNTRFR